MVVAYTALALASDDQVSKMISRVGEEVRANPRMSAADVLETEATATAAASGDSGHMLRLRKRLPCDSLDHEFRAFAVPSSNPGDIDVVRDIESAENLLEERVSWDGRCP